MRARRVMVVAGALSALCASGCGQQAGEDAAPDGSLPAALCDPTTQFGTPTQIVELAAPMRVTVPRLTPDELTIVYSQQATTFPADSNYDLYLATRASTAEPFGTPTAIAAANSGDTDANVQISNDGLTIYFDAGPPPQIFLATRTSTMAAFGPAYVLPEIYTEGINGSPFVTGNGEELWFASMRSSDPGDWDLYRATRTGTGFGTVMLEASLSSASFDSLPVLSADMLTIYFASNRLGGMGEGDIWRSHRATTSEGFPPPTLVPELNSAEDDYPGWLSPDGCRFYLSSGRDGIHALYLATRQR